MADELNELRQFVDEQDLTIQKMSTILGKIAEVIKGPPADNEIHSWHDLPELVKGMKNSYHALQVQFINSWADCHDGSHSACSKNHDED
jgi:UDP-glucose 6-dehydrogenase